MSLDLVRWMRFLCNALRSEAMWEDWETRLIEGLRIKWEEDDVRVFIELGFKKGFWGNEGK